MTDKPNTTREAVERLAQAMEARIFEVYAGHGNVIEQPDPDCNNAATTLRTLAAERDALRAEVATLRQAVERARGEALEEAAVVALAYSQKRRRDAAKVKSGAVLPKRQSSNMHGAAADAAYYLCQAIRARAGGAGDE